MKKLIIILLISCLGFCYSETESGLDCALCEQDYDVQDETDVITDAEGGETGSQLALVGDSCTENEQCETNFCLTAELLKIMGLENLDLDPDYGICSKLNCVDDAECGEQGACFDTQPFSGEQISVCLHKCETSMDCKYQMEESCFEDENNKVCVADAIIAEILCGDGVCDLNEQASGNCPKDCM